MTSEETVESSTQIIAAIHDPGPASSSQQFTSLSVPGIVAAHGAHGRFAWEEYFVGKLRNANTRATYLIAVRRFLEWVESSGVELPSITPGMVGQYFDQHPGSIPTKKLHMSAIRGFLDVLVLRHVIILNPALSVKTERFSVIEGKTPEITVDQARRLLASIDTDNLVGLRDKCIIAVLIYTAARAGAVAKLRIKDIADEGNQWSLRFQEKGGKQRSIPIRHDLQQLLLSYLSIAQLLEAHKDAPLFRTVLGRTGRLTENPISGIDICRIFKRRASQTGLSNLISPHSCRSCTATDLLLQGVPLEDVQHLLGHRDARITNLYDRRQRVVTRNIVERISV